MHRRQSLAVFDVLLAVTVGILFFRLGSAEAAQDVVPAQADVVGILKAYQSHAWWTVAAILIVLSVRALKDDRFILPARFRVAAPYRPALALALGVVAGVLDKVGTKGDWTPALLWGLSAATTAVFSHTLIVEAARGGRDVGEPLPPSELAGRVVTVPDWPERPRGSGLTAADKPPASPGEGS